MHGRRGCYVFLSIAKVCTAIEFAACHGSNSCFSRNHVNWKTPHMKDVVPIVTPTMQSKQQIVHEQEQTKQTNLDTHSNKNIFFEWFPPTGNLCDANSDQYSGNWSDIIPTFSLTFYLAFYMTFYLAFHLTFHLTYFRAGCLTFYLAFCLAFYPAFYLTYILTCLSDILSGIISAILSGIFSDIPPDILSVIFSGIPSGILSALHLKFHLTYSRRFCLTFHVAFYLTDVFLIQPRLYLAFHLGSLYLAFHLIC